MEEHMNGGRVTVKCTDARSWTANGREFHRKEFYGFDASLTNVRLSKAWWLKYVVSMERQEVYVKLDKKSCEKIQEIYA